MKKFNVVISEHENGTITARIGKHVSLSFTDKSLIDDATKMCNEKANMILGLPNSEVAIYNEYGPVDCDSVKEDLLLNVIGEKR